MNSLNLKRFTAILAIVMLTSITASLQAQPRFKGRPNHEGPHFDLKHMLPDLTDDQLKKLDELHTNMLVETTPLRKKMLVKRAELNAMSSERNVDMNEINNKIDEISGLHGELMKKHKAYKQGIRKMLNEKQRIYFDNLRQPMGHHGKDMPGKDKPGHRNFGRLGIVYARRK